jgi:excisionase family DNA binding protein
VIERILLTPTEAAEALSLGRTKVYELMAGGVLRSVKIGTARRVPREALDELVKLLSAGALA